MIVGSWNVFAFYLLLSFFPPFLLALHYCSLLPVKGALLLPNVSLLTFAIIAQYFVVMH